MRVDNDPWNLTEVGASEIVGLTQLPLDATSFDWVHYFSAHWHNRLVHFPVVLVCIMAVLSVSFWNGDRRYWPLFKLLWGACVLTLVLAVVTGQSQLDSFLEGSMSYFAGWHQWGGLVCTIALTLAYILAVFVPHGSKGAHRVLCVFLWLNVMAVFVVATLGGVLNNS